MQVIIEKVLERVKQLKEWKKMFGKEVESYLFLKEERRNESDTSRTDQQGCPHIKINC